MKDVARIAGVSQPTVSRVINNPQKVRLEVREKVLKVIEEIGFTPNKTAQTLKSNKSKIIGVSTPNITNPYFIEVIDSIEKQARQHHYNILVSISRDDESIEKDNLSSFLDRQVDGVIIIPVKGCEYNYIRKYPVPIISATWLIEGVDSVAISHYNAGVISARSMIKNNHSKIGVIGSAEDPKILGMVDEIGNNGLEITHINIDTSEPISLNRNKIKEAISSKSKLDITCLLTTNDQIAYEAKKILTNEGMSGIVVVGFDDSEISINNDFSSIRQPIDKISETAFNILLDRINNETQSEKRQIEFEAKFIQRGVIKNKK